MPMQSVIVSILAVVVLLTLVTSHVDGLRAYVTAFRNAGLTDDQIDLMLRINPARLLGLEP